MDADVREAIETLRRCGHDERRAWAVPPALRYLRARTSAGSSARAALERVEEHLLAYQERALAEEPVTWARVSGSIARLATVVEELPPVQTLTAAAQLREVTNDTLGVRADWSDTSSARVTATVTGDRLGTGGRPVLEQTVVLAKDDVPVAQVSLATLIAWAGDGAPSQLPERVRAG
jgi:hypothetical protein